MGANGLDEYWVPEHVKDYLRKLGFILPLDDMYTSVIDEVYQGASVSGVLNSGRRMVRAGHNAKEILIPKISVTGRGDCMRNVGNMIEVITYGYGRRSSTNYRVIRLFAPTKSGVPYQGAPRSRVDDTYAAARYSSSGILVR